MADPNPNLGPLRAPNTPPPSRDPPGTPPAGASVTAAPLAPKPSITSIQSTESGPSVRISAKPSLASLGSAKGLLGAPAPIAGFQGAKKGGLEDVPESPASLRQEKRWASLGPKPDAAPAGGADTGAGKVPSQGAAPEKPGYKKRLLTYLVARPPSLGCL